MARSTVYNDIVTDELYEKVNENNKELLDDFIEYLQSTGKSELTITGYTSDIKIYFIWNLQNNRNKEFTSINKRDVIKYQNWLMNTLGLGSSRVRRLRASISSMSNYVENVLDDIFPKFRNIINKIPAPASQPVREKTVFEDEDLEELLNILVEKEMFQEACALSLAMESGARKAELTRFKVDFFKPEYIVHGSLYRTPEKIKTKGRGGKMLNKYILANNFQPYLDKWLEEREKLGIDNEYLFVTKTGDEWEVAKVSTLDSWAERFNKYIDKHFYWHANRHFFTTSLAKANIPAEVIKQIVGWESVEMVSTYNDTGIDDELGKYFGEDGIKQVEEKGLSDL
ncbi:MAG: site-specific integrase [Tissierellia bacterium]|nr:site-specific integrase [Tissierellia bacterium]